MACSGRQNRFCLLLLVLNWLIWHSCHGNLLTNSSSGNTLLSTSQTHTKEDLDLESSILPALPQPTEKSIRIEVDESPLAASNLTLEQDDSSPSPSSRHSSPPLSHQSLIPLQSFHPKFLSPSSSEHQLPSPAPLFSQSTSSPPLLPGFHAGEETTNSATSDIVLTTTQTGKETISLATSSTGTTDTVPTTTQSGKETISLATSSTGTTDTVPTTTQSGEETTSPAASSTGATDIVLTTTQTGKETISLATSSTGTTDTVPTTTQSANEGPPLPAWATALICLCVGLLFLAFLSILFIRYRRSRIPLARPVSTLFKKSPSRSGTPRPIRVADFQEEYQARLSQDKIVEEFERVQEHSARLNASKSREIGQLEKNRNRNRFVDIIPFDDNYVQLETEQGQPPSNYVNASYIHHVYGIGKVIATQGPKQSTVVEFWRMVAEHKCRHIINLTNCMEGGRVKCFQYWPPNGQMLHFDDISLFTVEEVEVYQGLFHRKIEVQLGEMPESDSIIVEQLHLTTWPDHGVPATTSNLLAFMDVAKHFGGSEYTVIHCSAGVGRTGTYLAVRSLLEQVAKEDTVDILQTVMQLRQLRPKLVQTQEQYLFIYQVINLHLKSGDDVDGQHSPPLDEVLDEGVVNFGFEHIKL